MSSHLLFAHFDTFDHLRWKSSLSGKLVRYHSVAALIVMPSQILSAHIVACTMCRSCHLLMCAEESASQQILCS